MELVDAPHSELTSEILGAAIHVHRTLGPGFVEKIYEKSLRLEFAKRGIPYQSQLHVTVHYEGEEVGLHILDLMVDQKVVVEIKATREIEDIHLSTLRSYLRATGLEAGLLLNFRAGRLGIRRVVSTGLRVISEALVCGSLDENS